MYKIPNAPISRNTSPMQKTNTIIYNASKMSREHPQLLFPSNLIVRRRLPLPRTLGHRLANP
jgi:hypothetical protein